MRRAAINRATATSCELRGQATFASQGRFGACLESFAAAGDKMSGEGAVAKNAADLSPAGAFTLELWFQPKPEIEEREIVFLLDKKYYHYAKDLPQANWDYCLYLAKTARQRRQLVAYLGYGKDSAAYTSRSFPLLPGQWYHLAFSYDGAGTGRFFLNGRPMGRTVHAGRGPIAPGQYDLVLGDRYGSLYVGCPGYLDEVRLTKGLVPDFAGAGAGRVRATTCLRAREPQPHVAVRVVNATSQPLSNVRLDVSVGNDARTIPAPNLAAGAEQIVEFPVDSTLRPDAYPLKVRAAAQGLDRPYQAEEELTVTLVPRALPHRMPVVMWGGGDFETLQAIGFTHQLVSPVDEGPIWEAGQPTVATSSERVAEMARQLDEHLVRGMGAIANLDPGRWVTSDPKRKEQYQRVNREGKPYEADNVCGLFPEVQAFAYNVGASVAQTFGHFPALEAALIDTEIRDSTNLCFHEHDRAAYRAASGAEIPAEAVSTSGVHYTKIADFPADRVVPDNHPLLNFYRWFWKDGDGWNTLHSQVHRGLKATGRQDLWTFFDPAVRVPDVWGSGGEVDVISQWTYSYPDPIKIGQATDELFAMADGAARASGS